MICEPCAAAGNLTRDPGPFAEATRVLATEMHAECRGATWYPCQHRVATVEQLAERRAAL